VFEKERISVSTERQKLAHVTEFWEVEEEEAVGVLESER
jgi:hypothetical protein